MWVCLIGAWPKLSHDSASSVWSRELHSIPCLCAGSPMVILAGTCAGGWMPFLFPIWPDASGQEYFTPGGKPSGTPYPAIPMHQRNSARKLIELCMVSNFVEVFLAREGHKNPVGINFLEKVQMPHLASIYGAMLAGVGYVLMGAGIPLHIPGVLDAFAAHHVAEYKLQVTGAALDMDTQMRLDPAEYAEGPLPMLHRPKFLAIVSSNTLATTMLRRASGRVDGLVIESPTAGGHNAPPRGKLQLNAAGEPVYGERDQVNIAELRTLGVPFWLAGGYGNAEKLREALEQGAAGVQVGTAFAFSQESGMRAGPEEQADCAGGGGHRRGVYRSAGVAYGISVQGCATGGHFVGVPDLPGAQAGLRSGLSAGAVRWRGRQDCAIAAPPSRWRTMWPRAARLKTRWAANACATR